MRKKGGQGGLNGYSGGYILVNFGQKSLKKLMAQEMGGNGADGKPGEPGLGGTK